MTAETESAQNPRTGGCLCGAVRYRIDGPLADVLNCHCERCRRTSGHHVAAARAQVEDVTVDDRRGSLTWYRPEDDPSTAYVFCNLCGSSLFWQTDTRANEWSMHAGCLDDTTGLTTTANWFAHEAGSYFRLDPDLECFDGNG